MAWQLLQEMKELTAQIEYNRGDWNRITSFRNWNEYRPPVFKPPMAIESLRLLSFSCKHYFTESDNLMGILTPPFAIPRHNIL